MTPPGLDTNPSQVNYKEMMVFYLLISLGWKAESTFYRINRMRVYDPPWIGY